MTIEQYVEMVLGYLRTEDMSGDMAFCACSLDKIIREQIHKYARIFIGKKLALFYDGVDETVLTEKGFTGYNGRGENPSSGIGLYLSAKIMRKLGNKIYIESEQGQGTRVFLELKKEELEMYS